MGCLTLKDIAIDGHLTLSVPGGGWWCGGGGCTHHYINRAGAPYFLRLCDISGNLFRKIVKLFFFAYMHVFFLEFSFSEG